MKLLLPLLAPGLLVLAAAGIGTPAQAQNYPWCALIDAGADVATNCGFVSFEQCMETIRGEGGFCVRNTQYQPPRPERRTSKPSSHAHS